MFDLFHIGHLNLLEKSKAACDYLIVGVSSDELVKRYKGKATFIPECERVRIVSALSCVDEVRLQTRIDKSDAINSIDFDVMFHGDDWKNSELYESVSRNLDEHGVDLVFFDYTQSTSSSQIQKLIELELALQL